MKKRCEYCEGGYVKHQGVFVPCQFCITPERFENTLETAIKSCKGNSLKKKVLNIIKNNLPEYPVMALLEAENYGKFSGDFVTMLKSAYDIRPFMDVCYKGID